MEKVFRALYMVLVYIVSLPLMLMFYLFLTFRALYLAIKEGGDDKLGYFKDMMVCGVFGAIKQGCKVACHNTAKFVKNGEY